MRVDRYQNTGNEDQAVTRRCIGDHAGGRYEIQVVSTDSALTGIESEWDRLARQAAPTNPFVHPVWISAWWRAFGDRARLHLLAVRDQGRLVGVLPLMYSRAWVYGIPVRRLGAISNDHTPRFDLVARPDADGLHEAIWHDLMRINDRWDMLELPRLCTSSPSLRRFRALAQASGCRVGTWHGPESPLVPVTRTWSEYVASRSSNLRKNLRRKIRRLGREAQLDLEICSSAQCLEQALADSFRIEAASWKGRGGTAMESQPLVFQFYSELAAALVDQDRLCLHFL
ncbi:MAG: GNAT family N-acetyltransferase, partial [Wenzhouxiangella sp.]